MAGNTTKPRTNKSAPRATKARKGARAAVTPKETPAKCAKAKQAEKPKLAEPNKGGRPTDYTIELGELICERVRNGETFESIAKDPTMPSKNTLYVWRRKHREFDDEYARAREERADSRFDEISGIKKQMLDGDIKSDVARVAIDALKWQAGKEQPKKYGDRITQDLNIKNFDDLTDVQVRQLLDRVREMNAQSVQ